jgi:hypothetical protein
MTQEEKKRPLWKENKIKRDNEYNKKNILQILVKINKITEQEIIEHLEKQQNKNGYIKRLIIEDMKKEN